mgnify:CR=1 FL=1
MEVFPLRQVAEILTSALDPSIVYSMLGNYYELINKFKVGNYREALMYAGRFSEDVLRLLWLIVEGENLSQVYNLKRICDKLTSRNNIDSSLKCLAWIAYYVIYTIRSKRNAVHVNPLNPVIMDMFLVITASNWILCELVRLIGKDLARETFYNLMFHLFSTPSPLIENVDRRTVILEPLGCKNEVLLILSRNPQGLCTSEIITLLKDYYGRSTIYNAINQLVRDRMIVEISKGKYKLTSKGIRFALELMRRYTISGGEI